MANELTVGGSLVFDDGTRYYPFGKAGVLITVVGDTCIRNKQAIGAAEETVLFGDVAKGGYFMAYNGHATAVIQIRADTGETDLIRLEPGDICGPMRIDDGATPYAISSVAGAELEYMIIDP